MDTDTLVEDLIDAGAKLVEELRQRSFDVTAAFWLKASEDGKWYFYVVSPVVDAEGLTKAYRKLHPLAQTMQSSWINPLQIKLIGPTNPIARDVLAIHSRTPGPGVSPIRWGGKKLGNVSVDEAYLYATP